MVRSRGILSRVSQGVVFLLAVSAPLGSYASEFQVFGQNVYLFRLVILAALPLALAMATRHSKKLARPVLALMLVAVVWWLLGAVGFQWSPGVEAGLKSLAAVAFGLALLVLVWLLPCEWRQIGDALIAGWQVGFVITSLIAMWEVISMHHLPGYLLDNTPAYFLLNNRFAMATLGNPNNYGAYLLYVLAVLFAGAVSATSARARVLQYFAAGLAVVLLVMSGARLAMAGCVVEVVVLIAASTRRLRGRVVVLAFLLAGVAFAVAGRWGSYAVSKILTLGSGFSNSGSLQTRLNLVLDGAFLSFQHLGLGVGPGGFGPSVASGTVPFYAFGLVDPHSFFTEIASEYGVFSLTAFVLWLVGLLRLVVRPVGDGSTASPSIKRYRLILLLGLTGYMFAVFENSAYMADPTNWLFLITLAVLASLLRPETTWTKAKGQRSASRRSISTSGGSESELNDMPNNLPERVGR